MEERGEKRVLSLSAETIHRIRRNLLLAVIAGIVLIILAPFNTDSFTFLGRSLYWLGLCLAGVLGGSLFEIAMDFAQEKTREKPKLWQQIVGPALGAAALVSPFVFLPSLILYPGRSVGLPDLLLTIFNICVVSLVISAVGTLIRNRSVSEVDANTRPEIYDRLPPKLRQAEIHALRSEDHYVRVYTAKGDALILMRLSDAIKEIRPLTGIRTHRSWWVAEAGVETLKRSEGKTTLVLKNDLSIPVSRSGHKSIKSEGWL